MIVDNLFCHLDDVFQKDKKNINFILNLNFKINF